MFLRVLWSLHSLFLSHATTPESSKYWVADLQRARTKKPSNAYQGADQVSMSKVLNSHLQRTEKRTRACANWTTTELQAFLAMVGKHRSDELQQIYRITNDRRQMQWETTEDHLAEWGEVNRIVQ